MYCEIYDTTNNVNFRHFLALLKKRLRNPYSRKKVYVCLDNHRAHLSHVCLKLMKDLNFEPLWLPSYSSYFNSVGTYQGPLPSNPLSVHCQNTSGRSSRATSAS